MLPCFVVYLAASCLRIEKWCWMVEGWSLMEGRRSRHQLERRGALKFLTGGIATATAVLLPQEAVMAAGPPSATELKKLQVGHSRVQYLLQNWDSLTTTCGTKIMSDNERKQVVRTEGGGGGYCDRSPLRVQEFIGYKSTEDPLYRAEKLMVRAAPLVDPDSMEDYLDVVESYRDKADNSAMMAYTSSWGEANPNGGKEVIDDYLIKTKADVEATEILLRKVLGFLNLEVLAPSEKIKI